MKEELSIIGGLLSGFAILRYFCGILSGRIPPASSATWLMWTILDSIMLGGVIAAQKPIYLPLSYVVGASLVLYASAVKKREWKWGKIESFCAIGALASLAAGYFVGAGGTIVATIFTMTLAGMPLLVDMVKNPVRESFSLWATVTVACLFTLLGSDWTLEGSAIAWCGLVYNGTVAILSLRPKKVQLIPELG